ncbi:HAD family hydrolase [Poseidonibacter ostreae]|jgi:HAD superfamily hydrolase (TIGR01509 family)|uniref:phosphoglycolate phosphatase n=1 Tax=Poseidonibacter ostreae TaxID=2654171 RepID=A0A6L4WQJ5_9BACT|nr:HAD family phosphatase [Poseidonibacter ostreae]KAB7882985.1 HAD-IA family hydrolase [Poseidonibacter ostreae]KAB7886635.1 HAD-IA family hydrolase [Poseidonibacter ostreae]KAB7889245.1 HAD-IA family hydrolase [Poseidonibacter ostreae]MAC82638.1 HAD family hydrolase [Arcobacter sp.]|tara:strand:- start:8950 stop:9588 length:639 start_codon:yes stop_codon:yes gene_type:complete
MIENKKYILFDNDGVLVETEPLYFEANVKALKELDVELSFDRYMKIMARGGTAWELALEAGITKETIDKKRFQRDIYYQELIKTRDIEIPNVKEILKELSKKYKMAIITTSRREDFELIHKNRGIVDFMDFVLCVEDYPKAKPYPDPYLAGLAKFKALNNEAIVIEDSQRGLSSAVNAKIDCVIVKNEFTLTHDFSKASFRINKLEELLSLL